MIPACRLVDLPRGEAYRLDTDPPVSLFHTDGGEVFRAFPFGHFHSGRLRLFHELLDRQRVG